MAAITTGLLLKLAESTVLPLITKYMGSGKDAQILKGKIRLAILDFSKKELEAKTSIVMGEVAGNQKQRNWRPDLMYCFMHILLFTTIWAPLFNALALPLLNHYTPIEWGGISPTTIWSSIPTEFWYFITTCMGGYIAGRSYDKGKEIDLEIAEKGGDPVKIKKARKKLIDTPFNRVRRALGKSEPQIVASTEPTVVNIGMRKDG